MAPEGPSPITATRLTPILSWKIIQSAQTAECKGALNALGAAELIKEKRRVAPSHHLRGKLVPQVSRLKGPTPPHSIARNPRGLVGERRPCLPV